MPARTLLALALLGCNADPGDPGQGVTYRDGSEDNGSSGERGNIRVSEIHWAGSVTDDGTWDPTDQFIELRNEGNRPVDIAGWFLRIRGNTMITLKLPGLGRMLTPGEHVYFATKTSGCFPEPDGLLPELAFVYGEPVSVTLQDLDEHLIDGAGNSEVAPYAGGYDLVDARSMEKVEIMFGGRGFEPESWHYYSTVEVDIPNNDRVAEGCRLHTQASPGRPNSPDYSGAYTTGAFE